MSPRTSNPRDPAALNVLSVCAGYGGLDLGLRLAVPAARTVCYVEREAAAAQVLAARMSEGRLDPAPIWTDATTFDGEQWRGVVDCIAAGIPCQPWSVSGKQRGLEDERHLGEHLVRTVSEVRPDLVFVENVRGFVRSGIPALAGRLAELGLDSVWGLVPAAAVGAPHIRTRVFLLAYTPGRVGWHVEQRRPRRRPRPVRDQGQAAARADVAAMDSGAPGRAFPAGPRGNWRGVPEDQLPATESDLRRIPDGTPGRVDRLRMLGNGVIPLAAAHAFRTLLARAIGE